MKAPIEQETCHYPGCDGGQDYLITASLYACRHHKGWDGENPPYVHEPKLSAAPIEQELKAEDVLARLQGVLDHSVLYNNATSAIEDAIALFSKPQKPSGEVSPLKSIVLAHRNVDNIAARNIKAAEKDTSQEDIWQARRDLDAAIRRAYPAVGVDIVTRYDPNFKPSGEVNLSLTVGELIELHEFLYRALCFAGSGGKPNLDRAYEKIMRLRGEDVSPKLTIKEMIVSVLSSHVEGLKFNEIQSLINSEYAGVFPRTSISLQLSRLVKEGKINKDEKKYKLTVIRSQTKGGTL